MDKALSLMTMGELAKSHHDMETGLLWSMVMLGLLQLYCSWLRQECKIGGESKMLLSKAVTLWRCRSSDWMMSKVQFAPHRWSLFCHLAPSICEANTSVRRRLHVGSCPHRTSTQSPVASSSGTYNYLWETTSWFLKSTSLPAQLGSPCCRNTHKRLWLDRLFLPTKYHQWSTQTRTAKETNNQLSKGWVLEALDLQSLTEWPESEQKQARELLIKWEDMFVHSDLDLDKTALIKHNIQLTDQTPFKEHYQHIAPHMYNDM